MTSFGSIISGTMQPRDLIPAFAEALQERIGDDPAYVESRKLIVECSQLQDFDSNEAHEIVSELIECLEMFAPMYGYFGSRPGDGADWGYWLSEDSLRDAEHDGELIRVDDTSDVPVDAEYALHVNDHGNATLYRVKSWNDGRSVDLEQIWAVV